MAIVRGQWYQRILYPGQFYRVVTVTSSYVQLYPYDTTSYPPLNTNAVYVQNNFRLLAASPQNMLLNGEVTGKAANTRAYVLTDLLIWGNVTGVSDIPQSHALLDTTLRGRVHRLLRVTKARATLSRLQANGSVQSHSHITGAGYSVYPLGGHLAAQGRVVQAHAN